MPKRVWSCGLWCFLKRSEEGRRPLRLPIFGGVRQLHQRKQRLPRFRMLTIASGSSFFFLLSPREEIKSVRKIVQLSYQASTNFNASPFFPFISPFKNRQTDTYIYFTSYLSIESWKIFLLFLWARTKGVPCLCRLCPPCRLCHLYRPWPFPWNKGQEKWTGQCR